MLARTPNTERALRALKAQEPKRLTKARRRQLRDTVADILRTGEPTYFAFEATCRHGLRGGLVLDGWRWADADYQAERIVAAALAIIGAKRPTWLEGQPRYTEAGFAPILRSQCIRCGGLLPENHSHYCSRLCRTAAGMARWRGDHAAEHRARVAAARAAWSAKQPEQPCECCGTMFRPSFKGARFCSKVCRNRRNGGLGKRP